MLPAQGRAGGTGFPREQKLVSSRTVALNKRIAVLAGDGIGKEVVAEAVKVVRAAGAAVEFTELDWGAERYLKDGTTVPPGGHEMLAREYDAIFVGAFGDPRVP